MKYILFFIVIFIFFSCKKKQVVNKPFPQEITYKVKYITPSIYTKDEKNNQVRDFYEQWKKVYLKSCDNDSYFIDYNAKGWNVSEGTGYGMMIFVYMAGYDNDAKKYFDGLYFFYKKHPSDINANLMAWQQIANCETNPDGGHDAASDGDIDIAFALLLADKQWGSNGKINYFDEAKKIMEAIKSDEINPQTKAVKLGDWATSDVAKYYFGTRSSDFINDHFRSFARIFSDPFWNEVVEKNISVIQLVQNNYSPKTGLIPDFLITTSSMTYPVAANYLESEYDGDFFYNACRDPWRLTVDYLFFADNRIKDAIKNINRWIIDTTGTNVSNIASGYKLDGTPIATDYQDVCFFGAFAVSAMLETDNQAWLDSLYKKTIEEPFVGNEYFQNTLKLLYLLVLSENWWEP